MEKVKLASTINYSINVFGCDKVKKPDKIHVCFATDGKNYQARLLLTSLDSLRRVADDVSDYHIHILCDTGGKESIEPKCRELLDIFLHKSGFKFDYIDVGDFVQSKFKFLNRNFRFLGVTYPAWFKLVPPYFIDSNKVIYFDTDTLFHKDIRQIYNHNIDTKLLGCVEDVGMSDISEDMIRTGRFPDIHKDFKYNANSMLLFNTHNYINSDILDRLCNSASIIPQSALHDNSLLYVALNSHEVEFLPIHYHCPLYGLATHSNTFLSPLANTLHNLSGSNFKNPYGFCINIVTSQLQGPKDTRYFNDPIVGPDLLHRWNAVKRFCGVN